MPQGLNKSSDFKLVDALLVLWESAGQDGVSARQISAAASVPVSSIYHHFGSLEQLLVFGQEHAQTQAKAWCEVWLEQLSGLPAEPSAFPGFFAALVDDWAERQRPIAFAWREGQLLRTAGPAGSVLRARWRALWADFWQEAMARFGLQSRASIANRLFENESLLHMIRWRRPVDRAGLDELARGLGGWLTGTPLARAPWRDFARTEALRVAPEAPDHDEAMGRIVDATVALVEEAGATGVTHRAVAERAGLTLGTVSHRVRTKSDLLELTYGGLYMKGVTKLRARTTDLPANDPAGMLNGLADFFAGSQGGRGVDTLHLAVARDPALRQFGLQLRYLRGSTSRSLLAELLGGRREPGFLEAALMSGFLSSLARGYPDWTAEEARQPIFDELNGLIAIL